MTIKSTQTLLLNRKDAAKVLGIKPATLASWVSVKRYDLPIIRVGRSVRYRYADLIVFLERRTVETSKGSQ